jgi:hypothetical protein
LRVAARGHRTAVLHTTTSPIPDADDRVRAHTAAGVLDGLDRDTRERVEQAVAAGPEAIGARLDELEHVSDIERTLEINASILALSGTMLGIVTGRRAPLAIPAVVTAFLLQHRVAGWCPPMAIFRRRGIRSRTEIDAEKVALKAARGDFAPAA